MVKKIRLAFAGLARRMAPAVPHAIGLSGVAAIVVGVSGWLGWEAGAILAGLPFAGFWIWGEALKVTHGLEPKE